jgi:hypothetical protein
MKERRQRSETLDPARFNPLTPDGDQSPKLKFLENLQLPLDEINFAIFGVLPPQLNDFWKNNKPMGIHKALKKIIKTAFPVFIENYKMGNVEDDIDTLSHEALFHSIFNFMKKSLGKGIITSNPSTLKSQLSSAWDRVQYLSSQADTDETPFNISDLQKIVILYRNGTPQFRRHLETIIKKDKIIAKTHQKVMQEFCSIFE